MSRKTLVFRSALTPTVLRDTLSCTIDKEQRTPFSLSGFRGGRSLLGDIGDDTFRLRKRRTFRNDFARVLYARFVPEQGGTQIEAYFDIPRVARYFMRIWFTGAMLVGAPIFIMSALDMFTGSHNMNGNPLVGLLIPPALVLWGILMPMICRLLGRSEERFILHYVQETLMARRKHTNESASPVPIA